MFKELLTPSIVGDEKIKAFAEAFEKQFEQLYALTEIPCILPRIDELPEEVLDLLAWQFHVEGWELATSIEEKRNLVKNAIELHRYKGTKWAIKKVFGLLNMNAVVKEWFETGGEPYTFDVELLDVVREDTPIAKLIELINEYKNARSHIGRFDFTCIVENAKRNVGASNISQLDLFLPFSIERKHTISSSGGTAFDLEPENKTIWQISSSELNNATGATTDIDLEFPPQIPTIEIEVEAIPRACTAAIELSTEGASTVFQDFFVISEFKLATEAQVVPLATSIFNLEV